MGCLIALADNMKIYSVDIDQLLRPEFTQHKILQKCLDEVYYWFGLLTPAVKQKDRQKSHCENIPHHRMP